MPHIAYSLNLALKNQEEVDVPMKEFFILKEKNWQRGGFTQHIVWITMGSIGIELMLRVEIALLVFSTPGFDSNCSLLFKELCPQR